MARGDDSGPMADAGFKGHPMCKFCGKRFYGDQELYVHMQEAHEQCYICKRLRPDKYVYYRDYKQLEGALTTAFDYRLDHATMLCIAPNVVVYMRPTYLTEHFGTEHFPCREPACLEQKFVVFASEQELRQHMAREHSESMSKWERRQAMTLTPDIQVGDF